MEGTLDLQTEYNEKLWTIRVWLTISFVSFMIYFYRTVLDIALTFSR